MAVLGLLSSFELTAQPKATCLSLHHSPGQICANPELLTHDLAIRCSFGDGACRHDELSGRIVSSQAGLTAA